MLPHALEPDSDIVTQVQLLDGGAGPEERLEKYPHVVAQLVRLYRWASPLPPLAADATIQDHRVRAGRPVLAVRRVVALLSLLMVPATYYLARTWLSPGWSLVASALALSSLLVQSLSQQARPHAPVAAFIALGVAACLWMRRRPSWGSYLGAAGATGLAVGSLQSGLFALFPLGLAHLLRAGDLRARDHARAGAAGLVVAIALVGFYPFFFERWLEPEPVETSSIAGIDREIAALDAGLQGFVLDEPDAGLGGPTDDVTVTDTALRHGQHRVVWGNFDGSGFGRIVKHMLSYDPTLLVLVAIGLVVAAAKLRSESRRRDGRLRDLAVMLSFALPYLLVLGLYRNTLARYVLPLVPFFACLSAGALAAGASVFGRVTPANVRPAIALALAAGALALPTMTSVHLSHVRSAPDTIEQATAWLVQRMRKDPVVYHGLNLDLPLLPTPGALEANLLEDTRFQVGPWMSYLGSLPELPAGARYQLYRMPARSPEQRKNLRQDLGAYVRSLKGKFVVLLVQPDHRTHGRGSRQEYRAQHEPTELFQKNLRRFGRLAARFTAQGNLGRGGGSFDFEYAAGNLRPSYLGQLRDALCMGPVIEVYHFPDDGLSPPLQEPHDAADDRH